VEIEKPSKERLPENNKVLLRLDYYTLG